MRATNCKDVADLDVINSLTSISNLALALLAWYDQHGRKNLPWQIDISPYRVWLSEIMLQQTQVATVIPYFNNFLIKFPSIELLANSPLDEILHLWSGLGYYARARNLHKTANIISKDLLGIFPKDINSLIQLPGIGRSTAGAILSIAYEMPTPILDGNVKRVLSRYYAISGLTNNKAVSNKLWELSKLNTPQTRCRDYTQAIMDLGATLCIRSKPNCQICPLKRDCIALCTDNVVEFPNTPKKRCIPVKKSRFLIVINDKNQVLLEKRPPLGIWGGLWSLPECSVIENLDTFCQRYLSIKMNNYFEDLPFRHTFTHFHLDVTPVYVKTQEEQLVVRDVQTIRWWSPCQYLELGMAAPVKKLLLSLKGV